MLLITLLSVLGCRTEKAPTTVDDTIESEATVADLDGDGYVNDEDCDDNNASIHPGEPEVCDGIDNNCDGQIDEEVLLTFYADNDGDGFGDSTQPTLACQQQPNTVPNDRDCNDGNAQVFPSAEEICDEVDNDCNGEIDEGVTIAIYADDDGDGFGDTTHSLQVCEIETGYVTDNTDCDDSNIMIQPNADEICDGVDNNCDGQIDDSSAIDQNYYYKDADNDGFGDPLQGAYFCSPPSDYVTNDLDCDDIDSAIHPNALEICDGADNDCDQLWDELDPDVQDALTLYQDSDNDGFGNPNVSSAQCALTTGWSNNDQDCDDNEILAYTGATEVCDGVDNDCNGLTDDDDPQIDATSQQPFYVDSDGDGFGDPTLLILQCTQGIYSNNSLDCNDQDASLNPNTIWYVDTDGDGFGDPNVSLQICTQPVGYTDNDTDCNDQDGNQNPNTEWYPDVDGDGFGDAGSTTSVIQCQPTLGLINNQLDCDDQDALISPNAAIGCDDLDQNCDGLIDNDADGDGWSDVACGGSDCNDANPTVFDASGTVEECAVLDCDDLFSQDPTLADGIYWIDPDGNGAFEAYCLYDGNTQSGWTMVMRTIASDIPYNSNLWTSTTLHDESNWSTTQTGYSKYEAFNRVPFTEIRTAQPTDFNNGHTETFNIGYGSALELFSGGGVSLSYTSTIETYFLNLITDGFYSPYGCAQHRAYGFNQQAYLGTGFISSGSYCDWNGGARWGFRYNASHSGTGNHQGVGWGNYTTIGYGPQPITQMMWVR
jgi:hypothetical protein